MNLNDTIKTQITKVKLYVYEGDIVRNPSGTITNKLREIMEYEAPIKQETKETME